MAKYEIKDLRNIALCGQMGSGKTMLAEAMLFKAGALTRLGKIADGTTASDFDPEEKTHKYSINTSQLACSFAGAEFNLLDTPGGLDFSGGMVAGLAGCDLALICVNAARGVEVMTRKAWDTAGKLGRARAIVVTRMDSESVAYDEVLAGIQKAFGKACVPFTVPQGEGAAFTGVVDVFTGSGDEAETYKAELTENAVEADDAAMEKYLETGVIADEDLKKLIPLAIVKGKVVPVFQVAAEKGLGVAELMKDLATYAPSPLCLTYKAVLGEGKEVEVKADPAGPLLAQVFRTVSDPHVGKLCFVRVYQGHLEAKGQINISSCDKPEKVVQLYRQNGAQHADIASGQAGDIVAIGKVDALNTGDTIYGNGCDLRLPAIPFPKPMVGLAVTPKTTADEQKISTALQRLADEDPTFKEGLDKQTKELVIRGMGQVHLDVMLSRLHSRYKVDVSTKQPRIPYLETISGKAEGHHRHKKQTGGAGQFAEVYLRVRPNTRGEGFEFVNCVVGGAISGPFISSTEKGVTHSLDKGPLAGYPVVDVVVEVYDGKEHPVDSKDIAFQTAGKYAFFEALEKAKPVLLEPIVKLEVFFPQQYTGDISGDISGRRGRPTGMEMMGEMQVLKADVPLAEVADYGSALKAITQGEGFFTLEPSHYEPVPGALAQALISRLKAENVEHAAAH